MFGSRRYRSHDQHQTSPSIDPNATTAAAAVFKRHESNTSLLSAAAAAAALQAHPTAPTRVADVQTKRTLRRSASVASSATGASDTQGRPSLQRRGSSGSMTERTFRTPSPHRPGSSGIGRQNSYSRVDEMPPVPALPKDVETENQGNGGGTRQGAAGATTNSLGFKTSSLRLASQTLGTDNAPSWFGAAKMGDPSNVRRTDPAMASPPSSPPQAPLDHSPVETARPSSRTSSINFSYPKRAKVGSPTSSPVESHFPAEITGQEDTRRQSRPDRQPQSSAQMAQRQLSQSAVSPSRRRTTSSLSDQTLVYDPNSRRMVPRATLLAVEQAVLDASQKPVKTRRKRQSSQNSAGSHLAQGTVARSKSLSSRPDKEPEIVSPKPRAAVAREPEQDRNIQEVAEEPAVKAIITSPRIEAKRFEQQRANASTGQPRDPETTEAIEPVLLPSPRNMVRRQPSVVKEEPEPEDRAPVSTIQRTVSEALDSVPSRQRLYEATQPGIRPEGRDQASDQPSASHGLTPIPEGSRPRGLAESAIIVPEVATDSPVKTSAPGGSGASDALRDRTHSISPPRQAHFGPVQSNLSVIHSPPPRSVSPRKSALKHSSPSRGASPSDEASDASLGFNQRDEQPITRKKSVRVSFDDANTLVVGESASTNETNSPVVSSPQNRRPWYSHLGRAKNDLPPLDDDEVMKPRPALPSFGSIRDKKPRELNPVEIERPLVRPISESTYSPISTGSPSLAPSIASTVAEDGKSDIVPLAHSSDQAVGAVLGKQFEEDQRGAGTVHNFRDPLPPVVTSVEGNGYLSDTSSESSRSEYEDSEPSQQALTEAGPAHADPVSESATTSTSTGPAISGSSEGSNEKSVVREVNIPSISISEPSPGLPEALEMGSSDKYFDIPGGFPDDDSEPSLSDGNKATGPVTSSTSTSASTAQGLPNSSTTSQTQVPSQSLQHQVAEPSSDSESSIYSDAYEDLSDIEGDGFLSLDAVLESPPAAIPQAVPPATIKETTEAPTVEATAKVPETFQPQESRTAQLEPSPHVTNALVGSHPTEPVQDDWEKAKAYWRTLTADKRAQLEREALEEAGVQADMDETRPEQKPKKKKSLERRNSERKALAVHLAQQMMAQQQNGQASNPSRSYMIKPGTKWPDTAEPTRSTMRTSLRGDIGKQPNSTRGGDVPQFRKSMRSGSSESSQPAAKGRQAPLPAPIPVPQPQPTANGKVQKAPLVNKQSSATSGFSPIKRRGSTDSESSFKRSRARGSGSGHQGFSFRTSMRQSSPTPASPPTRQNKRFSLRSLSPMSASSHRGPEQPPVSLATGNQMRRTLRDSSDEGKSSSKVHMPTFGLPGGGKKSNGKKAYKPKTSSRFADSSDEDDAGGVGGFRSRFEDSSDEDVVAPMPLPVPLPKPSRSASSAKPASSFVPAGPTASRHLRNQHSVASTALAEELEESEELAEGSEKEKQDLGDNQLTTVVTPPAATLSRSPSSPDADIRRSRSGRGALVVPTSKTAPVVGDTTTTPVVPGTGRPGSSASKRSSFMFSLRRKKNTSSSAASDKISRPGISESAARRDTKLERSVDHLRGIRDVDAVEEGEEDENEIEAQPQSPQSPPRSPRLQKRIFGLSRPNVSRTGTGTEDGGAATSGFEAADDEAFGTGALKRPSTSGNLGTRTLSGGSVPSAPAFLQNRVASTGVMSLNGMAKPESVAGTPQKKKKKFGSLRRMFGLND
ncbi:hypothetical protein V8F20_011365 [Naviculisporaceae sp. PSN 640]